MKIRPGDAPLVRQLALATLVVLPVGLWWLRQFPSALSPCLMRTVWGVPCPTCGGTRAVLAMSQGRLLDAIATNPLITISTLALLAWAVGGLAATLVPRWRRTVEASPGEGRRFALVMFAAILASWLWTATS